MRCGVSRVWFSKDLKNEEQLVQDASVWCTVAKHLALVLRQRPSNVENKSIRVARLHLDLVCVWTSIRNVWAQGTLRHTRFNSAADHGSVLQLLQRRELLKVEFDEEHGWCRGPNWKWKGAR